MIPAPHLGMRARWVVTAGLLAACGGGDEGAMVEGDFAPGSRRSPTGVWVVESQRREAADSAGFRLADLTPGPVSIRLMDGADTAGVLNVSGLPPGARLRLRALRVDGDSRYAFPGAIELDGADVVTVNGMRLAPAGRVPREVDVRGAMLAWSSDIGAMLVRPADARLPDLRVVVGAATEFVGTDGGQADPTTLQPGDSLRVEGRSEQGYVVATRITVPSRIGAVTLDTAREVDGDGGGGADRGESGVQRSGGGGEDRGGGEGNTGGGSQARAAAPAPVVQPRGNGANGRGRGEERRRGRGNDRKDDRKDDRGKGGGKGKGKG